MDDCMSISDVKQFVDRHGGRVFSEELAFSESSDSSGDEPEGEVGHNTYGSKRVTHVFADRLEHDAADFDMPSNVETEDWGSDGVLFELSFCSR